MGLESGEDSCVYFECFGEGELCGEGSMGTGRCDEGVEKECQCVCVCECGGEKVRPCGDALVDLGVGGGSAKEEAVCTKNAFEDRGACEGGKVGEAWGEGVCRYNGGGNGCVGGEDQMFLVGASMCCSSS